MRGKTTIVTPELISAIKADFDKGLTQVEMMAKYELPHKKLRNLLDIPKGKKNYFRVKYNREEVKKDYIKGMPVKEIMNKHGITSYSNVYHIVGQARTKLAKKTWKQESRELPEPTCPIILRLREKFRNYEQNKMEIGRGETNLIPYFNVRPRNYYVT